MIVTTYNQHVRLLSSEPFGWFAPPKSTRAWEPTLLWNHYIQNPRFRRSMSEIACLQKLLRLIPTRINAFAQNLGTLFGIGL
jgi:hypothetical protein